MEFKLHINHIMVDVRSSSLILPLPSAPSSPELPPSHTHPPGKRSLPSPKGCGPKYQRSSKPRTYLSCTFQRDVGGCFLLDGGVGEGEIPGGPRKWEAHVVRFSHLSLVDPTNGLDPISDLKPHNDGWGQKRRQQPWVPTTTMGTDDENV